MSAKKKQNKESHNFKSRYDANRDCYRQDETTYVYQEWVDDGNGRGHYRNHVISIDDEGVTLELLDMLQQSDNAEAQDTEDAERFEDPSVHETGAASDEDGFDYSVLDNLSASCSYGKGSRNLATPFTGSLELIGPEALFQEEKPESALVTAFREKVAPKLTEDQQELILDLYGEQKTLEQVAAEISVKKGGKPITHQAVSSRLNKIKAKTRKLMEEE